MVDFYKRNERKILAILLAVSFVGCIFVWTDMGRNILSSKSSEILVAKIDSVSSDSSKSNAEKHEVRYRLVNAKYDYHELKKLFASIDGKDHGNITLADSKDEIIGANQIEKVLDLDNDGYDEAIVEVYDVTYLGNAADPYYKIIIYFDPVLDSFKKVACMGDVEKWNGVWTLVKRNGSLTYQRFVFEKGIFKKIEDVNIKESTPLVKYTLDDLFPNTKDSGEHLKKDIHFDLNGDGKDDIIHIDYWDSRSHANNYGLSMSIVSVDISYISSNRYQTNKLNLVCENLAILSTKTKGMNDLMEETFNGINVYQWDGMCYRIIK